MGRGERQSYCYLITNKESTDKLAILAKSTNGFVIAQRDLETRGPGDFLGKEQSGHINKVLLTVGRTWEWESNWLELSELCEAKRMLPTEFPVSLGAGCT